MVDALEGAVVVVTGGAGGIGLALAERFATEGARTVVIADLDAAKAAAAAGSLPGGVGAGIGLDVTDEKALVDTVARIESEFGPIGVWASNAGLATGAGLGDNRAWERSFGVHVLAHVYAARAVLPGMVERGRGYFLVTASAAGLLTEMDMAPYTVTKHGAVALAEWLAIRYGDSGVDVACLCPQGVDTPLLAGAGPHSATMAAGGLMQPVEVADAVVTAMEDGRFLVLPHPEVAEYEQRRAGDRDRWLRGMRRVRAQLDQARDQ